MKNAVIFIYTLFISINGYSQAFNSIKKDSATKEIIFKKIVQIDTISKDEIYSKGKQFFVEYFKSANNVIQLDDKESCKLIGKAMTEINIYPVGPLNQSVPIKMFYTIKIDGKPGKYKYEIIDIYYKGYVSKELPNPPDVPIKTWKITDDEMGKGESKKVRELYRLETLKVVNSIALNIEKTINNTTNQEW